MMADEHEELAWAFGLSRVAVAINGTEHQEGVEERNVGRSIPQSKGVMSEGR
jgi:hypothetical protein